MSMDSLFFDVKVALGSEHAVSPYKAHVRDAGWDLTVSRDVDIAPGDTVDVHTDVYMEIPEGGYGRITGRSSTLRNHHLLVNEGIIDSGYIGELFLCVRNLGSETFHVKQGQRLGQIIFGILPPVYLKMTAQNMLRNSDRGSKGFGSTGE